MAAINGAIETIVAIGVALLDARAPVHEQRNHWGMTEPWGEQQGCVATLVHRVDGCVCLQQQAHSLGPTFGGCAVERRPEGRVPATGKAGWLVGSLTSLQTTTSKAREYMRDILQERSNEYRPGTVYTHGDFYAGEIRLPAPSPSVSHIIRTLS